MAKLPYFPLWIGDYLKDTQHLNTAEHGAYLLLLIASWQSEDGTLPNDEKILARIVRADRRLWKKIRGNVLSFFSVENNRVFQKRLRSERFRSQNKSQKQSQNAKSRWLKNNESGDANAYANSMPKTCHGNAYHLQVSESLVSSIESNSRAPARTINSEQDTENKKIFKWEPTPNILKRSLEFIRELWPTHVRAVPDIAFGHVIDQFVGRMDHQKVEATIRAELAKIHQAGYRSPPVKPDFCLAALNNALKAYYRENPPPKFQHSEATKPLAEAWRRAADNGTPKAMTETLLKTAMEAENRDKAAYLERWGITPDERDGLAGKRFNGP